MDNTKKILGENLCDALKIVKEGAEDYENYKNSLLMKYENRIFKDLLWEEQEVDQLLEDFKNEIDDLLEHDQKYLLSRLYNFLSREQLLINLATRKLGYAINWRLSQERNSDYVIYVMRNYNGDIERILTHDELEAMPDLTVEEREKILRKQIDMNRKEMEEKEKNNDK